MSSFLSTTAISPRPTDRKSTGQQQQDPFDSRIESFLMYKQILCALFLQPNAIPVHLSEPFNINVEYIRLSSNFNELELLDKNHVTLEKIKISSIQNVEIVNNSNSNSNLSLSGSHGSLGSSVGSLTPPSSPLLARSTSSNGLGLGLVSGSSSPSSNSSKAAALLGLDGPAPQSSLPHQAPPGNSKAAQLLGLDSDSSSGSGPQTPQPNKKNSLLGSSMSNSPKFGLLARSASNNLLRDNSREDKSSSPTSIPTSPLAMSMGGGGSAPISMSPSTSSPLSLSLGSSAGGSGGGSLSSSPAGSSFSLGGMNSSTHYSFTFSITTKETNFSLNAREKEDSQALVDGIKLLALGRPHLESSQITLDSLADALDTAYKCRLPTVPPLPSSPPPPPPHLQMQSKPTATATVV